MTAVRASWVATWQVATWQAPHRMARVKVELTWKLVGWVAFLSVVALAVLAGLLAPDDDGAVSCNDRREALLEAKRDRLNESKDDPILIVAVADRAREARAAGCDVSDLIADSVG